MQTYARRLSQSWETRDLVTGAVSGGTAASATYDDFTLLHGFGRNPGVKFVDPTPGEFRKQYWTSKSGLITSTQSYIWSPSTLNPGSNTRDGYQGHEFGDLFASRFPVMYDPTVYNNALSDLYDGLRQSENNLALLIAEAGETRRMLPLGRSVYELILLGRRARRDLLRNPSKSISQIWLSYQYGWKPLLGEIHAGLNWLYQAFNDGLEIKGFSQRREWPATNVNNLGWPQSVQRIRGKRQWKCEVKVWAGLSNSTFYNAQRISSLNPFSIAWELVPLSFVIDWLWDVGGYLQNMEAALGAGLTFKRGYVTEIVYSNLTEEQVIDATTVANNQIYRRFGSIKNAKLDVWKRRAKLNGFPFPRAPVIEARLGWQRLVSATALLRTILLGDIGDVPPRFRPVRRPRIRYRWDDYPPRF